jgi:uncharacterized protein (UPF0333 family)
MRKETMRKINKKGQIVGNLQTLIMAIVTIAVILAVGLFVLQEVGNATKDNGIATASTNSTLGIIEKLGTAPTWIGILITVMFASAILAYFYMSG